WFQLPFPTRRSSELEMLRLRIERHALVEVALQLRLDHVLAVDREVVTDLRAAARAERHARQPVLLRAVVRHAEPVDVLERRRHRSEEHTSELQSRAN